MPVTLRVLLFWMFLSSDTSICSIMASPQLRNSDHAVVSVSIGFPLNSNRDSPFRCTDYSHADWNGLEDYLRDAVCGDIFTLSSICCWN